MVWNKKNPKPYLVSFANVMFPKKHIYYKFVELQRSENKKCNDTEKASYSAVWFLVIVFSPLQIAFFLNENLHLN